MLTETDKRDLYEIIESTIGQDAVIRKSLSSFNERTVVVVEAMINENARCNSNMKELVVGLISGSSYIAKGWLKRSLREFNRTLKSKKVKLNGYG